MKRVLVPLADGFEEIEAITIIDILRRAGAEVVAAGLKKRNVEGSHGLHLVADNVLAECLSDSWDLIVLPGGVPGTPNLMADSRVLDLIKRHNTHGGLTGAICAAPAVLDEVGITEGKAVTSHPSWSEKIIKGRHTHVRVAEDEDLVTGQAAGSAMEFAFRLVAKLYGPNKVDEINAGVLAKEI